MGKIRVLIADDHAVLRAGLRMLVNAQPDMEVVDEAADGAMAHQKALETSPDVVLMDITMPGRSGIQAIEDIRRDSPQTKVLILTMHDDPAYVRSVLAAGGAGYVIKKAPDLDLLAAIRAVYRGRTFVDLTLADGVAQDVLGKKSASGKVREGRPMSLLSHREREVLCLVAQGYMNRHIAERLRLSVKSVETYRWRIAEKLGLRSRADLVRYALEVGLLAPGTAPPGEDR